MTARRFGFAAGLLSLHAAAVLAAPAPTVGEVTRHNGLRHDEVVIVRTPTILPYAASHAVAPRLSVALDYYDRIADLPADGELRALAMRRSADIRVEMADAAGDNDPNRSALLQKAISLYQRLLKDVPDYAHRDRALYQLARAESMLGNGTESVAALQTLGREMPDSPLAAEAHFRAAEILFADQQFAAAGAEYGALVAQGAESQFLPVTRYKYAWSLYHQGRDKEALAIVIGMLDKDLPPGQLEDPDAALAGVHAARPAMVRDSLHLLDLCLMDLGGGEALNGYFAEHGEPRFSVALYRSLGAMLLSRHRYTDAAGVFTSYAQRHPDSTLAPDFMARAIAASRQGGFDEELVAHQEESYVSAYAPGSAYWHGAEPTPEVKAEVAHDLAELAPYHQHRAQQMPSGDAQRAPEFLAAANWYSQSLRLAPNASNAEELRLHYADALYDGQHLQEAAEQYEHLGYDGPHSARTAEAALAAVQVWHKLASDAPANAHDAMLRRAAASGNRFAAAYPADPHRDTVLTQVSEDYLQLKDFDNAASSAKRVADAGPAAAGNLRMRALGVYADARFAQSHFADAEVAYTAVLNDPTLSATQRQAAVQSRTASAYKVGESARAQGDLRAAAAAFQRTAAVADTADVRMRAEYDEASALYELHDWKGVERVLEPFSGDFASNPLALDADKKLGFAYEQDHNAVGAGDVYARLARRSELAMDARRSAAWLSARMYDTAQRDDQTAVALEYYVHTFPDPLDVAQQARRRLVDLASAAAHPDDARALAWLHEMIARDHDAAKPTSTSHFLAAQASLEIGRREADRARSMTLTAPLNASVARREAVVRQAIAELTGAATYGYPDISAAATYQVAGLYSDLASAISSSARPASLRGETLEQYNILLIEQADGFEQKAVSVHETNLARLRQGIWNDWIRKSADELARLAPDRYGKHEVRDDLYDKIL